MQLGTVSAFLAWSWVSVVAAQQPELEKAYSIEGRNPENAAIYTGNAIVTRRNRVYEVIWHIGAARHTGTGILAGDKLAVVFSPPRQAPGVALFEVKANGSLVGLWTALGATDVGIETWTPKGKN